MNTDAQRLRLIELALKKAQAKRSGTSRAVKSANLKVWLLAQRIAWDAKKQRAAIRTKIKPFASEKEFIVV